MFAVSTLMLQISMRGIQGTHFFLHEQLHVLRILIVCQDPLLRETRLFGIIYHFLRRSNSIWEDHMVARALDICFIKS